MEMNVMKKSKPAPLSLIKHPLHLPKQPNHIRLIVNKTIGIGIKVSTSGWNSSLLIKFAPLALNWREMLEHYPDLGQNGCMACSGWYWLWKQTKTTLPFGKQDNPHVSVCRGVVPDKDLLDLLTMYGEIKSRTLRCLFFQEGLHSLFKINEIWILKGQY